MTLTDHQVNTKVGIQGTNYDRKRKVTTSMSTKMKKMLDKGATPTEVGKHFGVHPSTVLYNTDTNYRAQKLAKMSGKHTGKTNYTPQERASYKRSLVLARKKVAYKAI